MSSHDVDDGVDHGSTVRNNLMKRPYYKPYCGRDGKCPGTWPRMIFTGEQFQCCSCGYTTEFPPEFIEAYKVRAKELIETIPEDFRSKIEMRSLF